LEDDIVILLFTNASHTQNANNNWRILELFEVLAWKSSVLNLRKELVLGTLKTLRVWFSFECQLYRIL